MSIKIMKVGEFRAAERSATAREQSLHPYHNCKVMKNKLIE